ncbi:MAG TPA: discoidin domain-containing protein, partial [Kiloniellales bacterium]|nr:discoidin domain-containing protein [Kiloniellales bacterium]
MILALVASAVLPSASHAADAAEPPVNLLTLAEGAVVLSASANAPAALSLTDGDSKTAWNNGNPKFPAPYVFVLELRAPTQLAQVGIDNAGPRPGGVAGAAVRGLRIEGSAEGPEAGFVPLGTIEATEDGETLIDVSHPEPLRWLRFTVESTQKPDSKWAYLDGVIAYGTQTPPEGERFTGVFASGPKASIEMHQ